MRKQPLEFRREEVDYVMKRWRAAESCTLVGVGSVGKSNLLQHLADEDVQRQYLGADKATRFKTIMIDSNLLGPLPAPEPGNEPFRCWAGYELMMHRLYLAFYPLDVLEDDAMNFYETYQMLQDGTNPLYTYMGLRYFELGLEFFLRRGIHLVFMFDEFEELMRQMPVKFFQTLRGLRDHHKNQLSYLTFARAPLPVVAEKLKLPGLEFEPFAELFTDNIYYVGPYNEIDGRLMLDRLLGRNQRINYPPHLASFLLYASGRYAGLLRAAFRMTDTLGSVNVEDSQSERLVEKLASRPPVRMECETIWKSLTAGEQQVLKALSGLGSPASSPETEQAMTMLVQKRLVHVDKAQQTLKIEPPLFRFFVMSDPAISG
ncbi:MAG: hypothetical protein MUE40_08910 [Anaerolineae bacterium]|nr:hypothetical protein [Anaerolineae bacterium]